MRYFYCPILKHYIIINEETKTSVMWYGVDLAGENGSKDITEDDDNFISESISWHADPVNGFIEVDKKHFESSPIYISSL